jgi:hypothetical protein
VAGRGGGRDLQPARYAVKNMIELTSNLNRMVESVGTRLSQPLLGSQRYMRYNIRYFSPAMISLRGSVGLERWSHIIMISQVTEEKPQSKGREFESHRGHNECKAISLLLLLWVCGVGARAQTTRLMVGSQSQPELGLGFMWRGVWPALFSPFFSLSFFFLFFASTKSINLVKLVVCLLV